MNRFIENQKCMHDDFDKTLLTDRGKKHVREYDNGRDAQSAGQKLNSFCTESTNSHISVFTTLSHAT